MTALFRLSTAILALTLALAGCGKKSEDDGGGGSRKGEVQAAFDQAARDTGVPARFLMAAAWVESRMAPDNASANYVSIGTEAEPILRGTLMTQTAFGQTYTALGLDASKPESEQLETQVAAYARWVASSLAAGGVTLAKSPKTPEDKFYWIENLALLHRKGLTNRRNVQVVFAKELINTLNEGFLWQDPRNGERLELDKESPPIDVAKFPQNGQNWFALNQLDAQLYVATYLPLVTVPADEFENKPRRVEVIHCPLTLSACLELQTRAEESDVHLAAHYIIPADKTVFSKVLQVADHKQALVLTNDKGENVPVNDAIVIMLAGNSGRTVKGTRMPAIPTWFTDQQLRMMAQVVNDVCTLIAQKDTSVNRDECMATSGDKGVRFHHQGKSEEYRWGDIPDYDDTIFDAYVRSPGGLGGEVAFEFKKGDRAFKAGSEIPLTVLFDSQARTVELERLSRCEGGKLVWEPVRIQQVRGEKRVTFDETLHDSGPNKNGDQFFRARVYGRDGKLIGWSIDQIFLSKFEPDAAFASDKSCND